jgi:hypothetical protein
VLANSSHRWPGFGAIARQAIAIDKQRHRVAHLKRQPGLILARRAYQTQQQVVASPPMVRLEPGQKQLVRLIRQSAPPAPASVCRRG